MNLARGWRWAVLVLVAARLAPAQSSPFAPYLTDEPPAIVEIVYHEVRGAVEVSRLKFLARHDPRTDRDVIITAYLARPTSAGPHPGILVCHGGGGTAEQVSPQVIGWAEKGYVSVCQDQPGIYNSRLGDSSGPSSDPGAGRFRYRDDITDSALYDGVVAALQGLALLRSQPDVDRTRIGVTGGSWGGYMTTMVSGLAGDRVKACFAVYGCGFYDHGAIWLPQINALGETGRQAWLDQLDAGRPARQMTAAYMVATATNDWFFWPSAMMATYGAVQGPRNIVWAPNDSHALNIPGGTQSREPFGHGPHRTWLEQCWLDYQLKNEGDAFPQVVDAHEIGRSAAGLIVEFQVDGPLPLESGQVWYSAGELPYRLRWWHSVPTETLDRGLYRAVIPIAEPDQPLDWFGTTSDSGHRGASSLIRTVNPVAGGQSGPDDAPGVRFDFEDPAAWRQCRREYNERRAGRIAFTREAAREGRYGLSLTGPAAATLYGVRAATLRRTGATRLELALRAPTGSAPCPQLELLAEAADGTHSRWGWDTLPETITDTWQTLSLPLAEAQYRGKGEPPFGLLTEHLGQLLITPADATPLAIDEIVFR